MTRRSTALLAAAALGSALCLGCESGSKPATTPSSTTEVNYGENKMPPADQIAPKRGKGARSPGAPPARE